MWGGYVYFHCLLCCFSFRRNPPKKNVKECDLMQNEIIIAVLSLAGTFAGSFGGMKLMSYRIEQLERKVDKHNNFAERIPILEEKIKVANHRIDDVEKELMKHD